MHHAKDVAQDLRRDDMAAAAEEGDGNPDGSKVEKGQSTEQTLIRTLTQADGFNISPEAAQKTASDILKIRQLGGAAEGSQASSTGSLGDVPSPDPAGRRWVDDIRQEEDGKLWTRDAWWKDTDTSWTEAEPSGWSATLALHCQSWSSFS